ncbi:hypothetical protein [Actinophytocola oryzae]|uniref:Secreted protein n=1 Tax=Actinophytocola oryzae TaxID=502181 RepID=A0A4R7VCX5_9PSEU|nr:hypothetical protein [Actinophytocola oryzae]TDV46865.1 hypothetical protein CLV71_11045 [Actinophytocola oryzae]
MVTTPVAEEHAVPGARRVLSLPATAVRSVRKSAASTPGRLFLVGVGLVVLALLTGVVGALAMQQKQSTIDNLVAHREPVAAASQQIYRSLSDADATAASAFLAGGTTPTELRDRYDLDIATAGANLAKASADVSGVPEAEKQVNELAQQLPVYTGLVEVARAYNRQGYPSGAAYLREASGLMRAKLLPAANELYEIDSARLADSQVAATSVPWFSLGLAVVLLGALVAAQLYLTRRTNRLLNVGLVVATGAVVVALIWGTVALLIESSQVSAGREHGSGQSEVIVQARIVALKMRANETLTLVARGDGGEYEDEFKKLSEQLTGDGQGNLLNQARGLADTDEARDLLAAAQKNVGDWLAAHEKIRRLDDDGSYQEAVSLAISPDAKTSAANMFTSLDDNLLKSLRDARERFADRTSGASRTMTGLTPGVGVLALVAAAGVTMGIRDRLQEYR